MPAADDELRPLHVRVAEALGWTDLAPMDNPRPPHGQGCPCHSDWEGWHAGYLGPGTLTPRPSGQGLHPVSRYDTDWSATGPLIEQYGITLIRVPAPWMLGRPDGQPWEAYRDDIKMFGETALLAACRLIVALHSAGKLQVAA